MSNPINQKDILSIKDFSKSDLSLLFSTVNKIETWKFVDSIIISTGAQARWLNIDSEKEIYQPKVILLDECYQVVEDF